MNRPADNSPQSLASLCRNGDQWYFAYASNLWKEQMERHAGPIRTGDERPRVARLAGYRLAFNKPGAGDEIYASIVAAPGEEVIGAIYLYSPEALNRMYGPELGYERAVVEVVAENGERLTAVTYIAVNTDSEGRPTAEYLNRILTGARQHALPEAYIERIRQLAQFGGKSPSS